MAAGAVACGVVAAALSVETRMREQRVAYAADDKAVNWDALRKDIASVLAKDGYDDGSYGPVLVRLAWHACGTYDKTSKSGGSDGASMRFEPESKHGANAGLDVARGLLDGIKTKHPNVTYSDLWQFAAVVAIEEMGGPKVPFRPGRVDYDDGKLCTPDGRLPDAAQGAQHIRDIFYRMGFNDQEIVALSGAHTLGRCHTNRSGFDGPWTKSPTMFSNSYFIELLDTKWSTRTWTGPKQFEDPAKELMMLPTDLAIVQDDKFRVWAEKYKKDEALFFKDFSAAFNKLQEVGVKKFQQGDVNHAKPWYQFW